MPTLVVASTNPAKLRAVRDGFARALPDTDFDLVGRAVPSGVADQPMSDAETRRGALQRAEGARRELPEAAFWVGVEGGVEEIDGILTSFAWVAVRADDDPARIGESRTASFALPPEITALVHGGMELGDAIDQVFRRVGSKRRGGAVGLLTEGVIGRDELIAPAVVLALIPHLRRDLYDDDGEFPRGSRLGARAPVPG